MISARLLRPGLVVPLIGIIGPVTASIADGERPTPEQARFFEASIRPILVERCLKCHGAEKQKGGLRLDSRAAILGGGDGGAAVDLDDPAGSLLLAAINHEGPEMPPNGKLDGPAIEALTAWVRMGVPWPDSGSSAKPAASAAASGRVIGDEDRAWWAFQPVRDPEVPDVADASWPRNPIDRFLGRRLESEGLSPAPEASRASLVRRLTFDLTGLPPTPEEVRAFETDPAPDAYERLVDRLLASPRYGERRARLWLDLVRYADSDGYRIDHERPTAWRYRDYVVRSLNEDKPYDRFVREQLAGDELAPDDPDARVATGFLRHTIYEYNNRDVRGQWSIILDDVTDTTSDVFLGLGLQCARCHDHKFDPLLRKDYYRLRAFFAPILPRDDVEVETAIVGTEQGSWEEETADLRRRIAEIEAKYRGGAAEEAVRRFPEDIQAIFDKSPSLRTPLERQLHALAYRQVDYEYDRLDTKIKGEDKETILALRKQLSRFDARRPAPPATALTVVDVGPEAPPVVIPRKENDPIAPGFPTIFGEAPAAIEPMPGSTGRRSALARWLTRPDHPLTPRVIVNRIWQAYFGRGLAANASDFGHLGEPPSHPDLLDWLTTRFVEDGWSLKALDRRIVTSAAYRQSTRHPSAVACWRIDPENRLLWRGRTHRLDAEQVRDAVLAISGVLDATGGGPPANPNLPRRTLFTKQLRNSRDPLLDVFDLPLAFVSSPSRDTTTTPLQSLYLLNSQAMRQYAAAFAGRIEKEAGAEDATRVETAYRLAFGRPPEAEEVGAALRFLSEHARTVDPVEAGGAEAALRQDRIPHRDGRAVGISPKDPGTRLEVPHDGQLESDAFTVEAFFLLRSIDDGAAVRTIVAKWDGDVTHPGWAFGVTGRGSRRKPQTLVLQLIGDRAGRASGEEALFSDHHIRIDRPYFAAAAVRPAKGETAGTVAFYLKDLSDDDEPLLTATVPHSVTGGLGNGRPLTLGSRAGKNAAPFDGLIDDVRLSAATLDAGRLLFTSEGSARDAVGYWRFEAEPGVFRDSSGRAMDIRPTGKVRGEVDPRRVALEDLAHVLLNSNEFLYVD